MFKQNPGRTTRATAKKYQPSSQLVGCVGGDYVLAQLSSHMFFCNDASSTFCTRQTQIAFPGKTDAFRQRGRVVRYGPTPRYLSRKAHDSVAFPLGLLGVAASQSSNVVSQMAGKLTELKSDVMEGNTMIRTMALIAGGLMLAEGLMALTSLMVEKCSNLVVIICVVFTELIVFVHAGHSGSERVYRSRRVLRLLGRMPGPRY
jgi:hypothetical protein